MPEVDPSSSPDIEDNEKLFASLIPENASSRICPSA